MSIDVFPATVLNSTLWNGQTYEEGTFTVTATGMTTTVTGTAQYIRTGKQVTLVLPALSGMSNSSDFTLTGLPTSLFPARNQVFWRSITDNGTVRDGNIQILTSGTLLVSLPTYAGFTASGTKAMHGSSPITYEIASALAAPGWTGQSYEEGTFTVTGTGFSGTAPSGTARYVRVGKSITLCTPFLSGTSNATTFTLTGLPTALRPSDYVQIINYVQDNDTGRGGLSTIEPSGLWTVRSNILTGDAGNWTASGGKAVFQMNIAYVL